LRFADTEAPSNKKAAPIGHQTRHHDTVISDKLPEVHSQGKTIMDNAKIIEAEAQHDRYACERQKADAEAEAWSEIV
jgi:hypothetical protein